LVTGDITEPESLPAGEYSHILHAATDSTFGPTLSPLERYEQIVDGTRHMLDFAVANKVPRFLLTSSGGVYGPQPQSMENIPETYNCIPDPLKAKHTYSLAKRCAEHLCALYQERHGVEVIIARCFTFVGRDLPMDAHFAIGNFIRDALRASEITVMGNGMPIRSYMDQRDLADWLMELLVNGKAGHAYNVGSDFEVSIAELAFLIRDLLAPAKTVRIVGESIADGLRDRYVPSIEKAKDELGLKLNFNLKDAICEAACQYASKFIEV
jgi:dTDP-glucose 4,6-dehydratase